MHSETSTKFNTHAQTDIQGPLTETSKKAALNCGFEDKHVPPEIQRIVAPNASVSVIDRYPCNGYDRYVYTLKEARLEGGLAEHGRVIAQGGGKSGRFRLDHVLGQSRKGDPKWITGMYFLSPVTARFAEIGEP